jgi:hypothetical protein
VLADRETSAIVFKPSTTTSPPLVDQLRGADGRAGAGLTIAPTAFQQHSSEIPDHRCGRETLRVPEVGDPAPVQSRRLGRRWKATSAT